MDTQRNAEFLEILKTRLKPERLYHSICVAEQAKHLAEIFDGVVKPAVIKIYRKADEDGAAGNDGTLSCRRGEEAFDFLVFHCIHSP